MVPFKNSLRHICRGPMSCRTPWGEPRSSESRRVLMFVSDVSDEVILPSDFGARQEQYWRSIGLGAEGSWFVVTRSALTHGLPVRETTLVMWAGFLAALVRQHEDIVSIQCMLPAAQPSHRWTMLQVNGIWVGKDGALHPPIFKIADMQGFRDEFLHRVPAPTGMYFKAFST